MAHSTTIQPQQKKLRRLEQEVMLLRSLMISWVGQDDEGIYRPEFVRRILKSASEKPTKRFVKPSEFLNDLQDA